MNYINIRTDEEVKKLADLADEIWHEYWTCLLSIDQINYMVEKFQSYNAVKNQLKNDNYIYNIIEDNSNIIGYFGVSVKEDYLFLSKLYIKLEYRHKGYGNKAFDRIKQIARENGKLKIQLTVNKHNTNTINAYIKWGFKSVNAVVTDIGSGFVMDDFIMEYLIKDI